MGLVALGAAVAVPSTVATATAAATAPLPTTDTATFTCTGYAQHWAVPDDVTSVTFDAIGAAGASESANYNYGTPGNGAEVQGTVPVTPGEVLTIDVGCTSYFDDSGFGYSIGGVPGTANGGQEGTAGGSSTGVVGSGGSLLLVAGGGGGGGGQAGGLGNSTGGAGGSASAFDSAEGAPGNDGTGPCAQAPGGSGGSGTPSSTSGSRGQGGQDALTTGSGSGGGGGGGYVGGGGAGSGDYLCAGGGGGAGSSYLPSTATGAVYTNTTNPGQVAITYTSLLPAATVQSDTCTGAGTTYTVPADVDELEVLAVGAAGNSGFTYFGRAQSDGAGELQDVAVTPGEVLTVGAGCTGSREGAGGQSAQQPGGYGLATGGSGGAGTEGGSDGGDGTGGGGSSGVESPTGTVLVEAAGGGGVGGAGCVLGVPAPYVGCSGDSEGYASGAGGALGAPGTDPAGADATDGLTEEGGGGGGGSSYGPGGGGSASPAGSSGSGGGGGGGLSYPAATTNYSNGWGDGNVSPTPWYEYGELFNQSMVDFDEGNDGLLDISPVGYVAPTADLAVKVLAEQAMPNLNDLDTYDITLTNNGPGIATSVTVANTLPSALHMTGQSVPTGTTYDASTGDWSVPLLAAGQSEVLELTVAVSSYGTFLDSAHVSSTGPLDDPTPGNNASNAQFTTAEADVAVTDVVTPSYNGPGGTVDSYTITVSNPGPSIAQGVTATNTLPQYFTYQSSSATTGSVTGSPQVPAQQWDIGDLGAGDQAVLTVAAADSQSRGGTDDVTISSTSPTDTDTANNSASATTGPDADLGTGTDSATSDATVGETVDVATTVYDYTDTPITSGTVTVALPSDLSYVSSDTPGTFDSGANTYIYAVGNVAAYGQTTENIEATVLEPADQSNRTATVTSGPAPELAGRQQPGQRHLQLHLRRRSDVAEPEPGDGHHRPGWLGDLHRHGVGPRREWR